MPLFLSERIEEARRATVSPSARDAAVERHGYMSGIPIGGATETNQGSAGTVGNIDRKAFMQQLLQAYLACPWASSCVDVIARTATAGGVDCVPDKWSGDAGNIPEAPPEVKEVNDLLAYINPYEDSRQLFRNVLSDLLIYGDSFTEIVFLMGKPIALYSLDPATMAVLADEHGNVNGYVQQTDTGREAKFQPWEVIHVKLDDPGAGLYGVSPTQKAILPITTWLFTAGLVKEAMKRGDPRSMWVDWPMALPTSEMQRLQQQYQIRNLGAKNIGNLFETKGGAQVKELATNQLERWLAIMADSQQAIMSEYGVPPSKVAIEPATAGSTGGNSTADRVFQVNTVGPLSELVLEKFTFRLLHQCFGVTDWHLRFGDVDWRDDMTVEQIADLRVRNGRWTLNRSRAVVGEPPVPGGDQAVLVDRTNIVPWKDLQTLSDANIKVLKAKAAAPPSNGSTPGPRIGTSRSAGPKAARSPNAPRPKTVSRRAGGTNPSESLHEEWDAYLANKAALLEELGVE